MILFNTFIFYLIYVFSFFSLAGYGLIYNHKKVHRCNYENFFYGILTYLCLGFFLNIFNINNSFINILIHLFGLLLFFYKSEKNIFFKNFWILTIFFLGLLVSKTHEDFVSYHYQTIINIVEKKLIIGEANLKIEFGQASLFSYVQSLFHTKYSDYKLIFIPSYLIYVSSIGYLIVNSLDDKKNNYERLYCIFFALLIITKFSRLAEFGYDYIAQFILIICGHKIFFSEDKKDLHTTIIFFSIACLIKPVSLFFTPILLWKLRKILNEIFFKKKINTILILFFIIITFMSNSFIRTGCLFYPVDKLCFQKNLVPWSAKVELKENRQVIEVWAKGFFHQNKTNYKKIDNINDYLKNLNWVKYWIKLHFFYKIFEYLLIILLIFLVLIFISKKIKKKYFFYEFLFSTFAVLFWFSFVPQFRFGLALIGILFYYIFINLTPWQLILSNKKIKILFLMAILIFNFKNILRIQSELSREDRYKFINFPWFNERINDVSYNSVITSNKNNYILIKKL